MACAFRHVGTTTHPTLAPTAVDELALRHFTAGLRASVGPVSLVLAPDIRYEQNREFRLVRYPLADRSPYSARWHWPTLPISIDLPTRFGDESRAFLGPGQTSLTVDAGPLAVGWATDDQWWGPGIRNAIVMSNNAPGFPHLYVRTATPVRRLSGAGVPASGPPAVGARSFPRSSGSARPRRAGARPGRSPPPGTPNPTR